MFSTASKEKTKETISKYTSIAKNIRESKAEIFVASAVTLADDVKLKNKVETLVTSDDSSKSKKITLAQLIQEAKKANQTIIFTITPGPFKDAKELPPNWMSADNKEAQGCSNQLNAFEKALKEKLINPDTTTILAINNKSSAYQCGPDGLLKKKSYEKLHMVSDESGALRTDLGLPVITVDGGSYLARLTIVLKPNGEDRVFELSSPVNPQTAEEHVQMINDFISPKLDNQNTPPSPKNK